MCGAMMFMDHICVEESPDQHTHPQTPLIDLLHPGLQNIEPCLLSYTDFKSIILLSGEFSPGSFLGHWIEELNIKFH